MLPINVILLFFKSLDILSDKDDVVLLYSYIILLLVNVYK